MGAATPAGDIGVNWREPHRTNRRRSRRAPESKLWNGGTAVDRENSKLEHLTGAGLCIWQFSKCDGVTTEACVLRESQNRMPGTELRRLCPRFTSTISPS